MTTKHAGEARRSNHEHAPSRIEEFAAEINEHVAQLNKITCELHEEATRTENAGCSRTILDAIDLAYVTTPIQLLLIATRIILDSLGEDSNLGRDDLFEIVKRYERNPGPTHEMGRELLDLMDEAFGCIKEARSKLPEKEGDTPVVH